MGITWIILAAAAQLINAVVALVDKYIVSDEKALPRPFVYGFYTCLISGAWVLIYLIGVLPIWPDIIAIPSIANVLKPTLEVVALAYLGAYTFFIALVSLFSALKVSDASDVVPVVGAVSAIVTFGLGYFFFETKLSPNFLYGLVLLATGTFLVSRFQFPFKIAMVSIHAGVFFAFHYIALKGLFNITTFDNGFFWSRIAFVLFALSLLMVPTYFAKIKEQTASAGKGTGYLIFGNKILAGIATIMILKATELGDAAVVQALGGLQYVFILILGIVLGTRTPKAFGENECRKEQTVLQKALFVAIISLGFIMLFQ